MAAMYTGVSAAVAAGRAMIELAKSSRAAGTGM